MAVPMIAPALERWCVWMVEGGFAFVTDTDCESEWSMVTVLGAELAGNSAYETEKFPCSELTSRYASWKNVRPSVFWLALDARRRGKYFVPLR